MNSRERIKKFYNILFYNLRTLVSFEIIYKLLLSFIFIPLVSFVFNLILKLSGYNYITLENLSGFAMSPLAILFFILIIIFYTFMTLFDISTMIIIFDASYHEIKVGFLESIKISFSRCKKILKPKNILVAFLLLFLIPFLNFAVGSSVISSIQVPGFIVDYIQSNNFLTVNYLVVYLLLFNLLFRWIFSLHYMILENNDFKAARKKSSILAKDKLLVDIITIFILELVISMIYIVFSMFCITLIYVVNYFISKVVIIEGVLATIVSMAKNIILVLFTFISNAISYSLISTLYYSHKVENNEAIAELDYSKIVKSKSQNKLLKKIINTVVILSIIGGSFVVYNFIVNNVDFNIERMSKMDVTAHRGASAYYPENTMSAFKGAKELGATYIELDIQQTKDGYIVVSHDPDLSRCAGFNKYIIESNYSELASLDLGSYFSARFKDEKIPLLEDAIIFAKENNMKLNIEFKPTGKEKDLEKDVIELIKTYDMEDNCELASGSYYVLENIKEIDSNIKTIYVMSLAIGDITLLDKADIFSIEESNINRELVNKIHSEGKKIYAWTINDEDSIDRMILLGVDNIITDQVELTNQKINKSKKSSIISEFSKVFE